MNGRGRRGGEEEMNESVDPVCVYKTVSTIRNGTEQSKTREKRDMSCIKTQFKTRGFYQKKKCLSTIDDFTGRVLIVKKKKGDRK